MKSKTTAAWLAFVGGPLGLHRFYLHGFWDLPGWLLPVPTALGLYGIERVQQHGQDDHLSWLLIPLSIPFMWVLFVWKRGVRAYDHAIFVTYSIAFMSLLFVALSVLYALGLSWGIVSLIGTTVPLIHIYRQLRGTYLLSRFSAIWRLVVLTVFIVIIASFFLQILLVLGAF